MAKKIFKSTASLQEGMQVECDARGHKITLDEQDDLNGTDTGQSPSEAVLSALGACKCIVARTFAKEHKIDIQDLRIELEGELDPDGFLGKNKDVEIGFTTIKSKIYIKSNSSKEDIEKFIKFMDKRSPVANTLTNSPEMVTELTIENKK